MIEITIKRLILFKIRIFIKKIYENNHKPLDYLENK